MYKGIDIYMYSILYMKHAKFWIVSKALAQINSGLIADGLYYTTQCRSIHR